MNFLDDKVKALAEIGWEENKRNIQEDLSGWEERIYSNKSKSLEIRCNTIRPKLMLPKPLDLRKKKYFPTVSTPQPVPLPTKNKVNEEQKIENLIMKLLERSRRKSRNEKTISADIRFSSKIVTKIPFLNYRLNYPRTLNILKSPNRTRIKSKQIVREIQDNFAYRLTGTSLISKR